MFKSAALALAVLASASENVHKIQPDTVCKLATSKINTDADAATFYTQALEVADCTDVYTDAVVMGTTNNCSKDKLFGFAIAGDKFPHLFLKSIKLVSDETSCGDVTVTAVKADKFNCNEAPTAAESAATATATAKGTEAEFATPLSLANAHFLAVTAASCTPRSGNTLTFELIRASADVTTTLAPNGTTTTDHNSATSSFASVGLFLAAATAVASL